MQSLFGNIRFYILSFSVLLSIGYYFYVSSTIPDGPLQIIRLTQLYALTAVTFLYFTLLATPLVRTFTRLPFRGKYLKARRALGVSAFYFSLLHACFAFFGQLGGFPGLFFLDSKYLLAISFSFTALIIFTAMALTANEYMVNLLTFPRWKILHRLVYIAGVLVVIHALMLGTHFSNLSTTIPQIFYGALAILLILESIRIDNYLQTKLPSLPRFGLTLIVIVGLTIATLTFFLVQNTDLPPSLGIHSTHIQIAKEAQNQNALPANLQNNPAFQGDRTRRFTVSFNNPVNISANTNTQLVFQVFNASSGERVQFFNKPYEKFMHLIIVDNELEFFSHIHPDLTENGFTITTKFPHDGKYHIYLDFQPLGAIEQQFAFTTNVGFPDEAKVATQPVDTHLSKNFEDYTVDLNYPNPLRSTEMSVGNQLLKFSLTDSQTNQPVTNLKPYLAAFGHLVMINQQTYDYLHVHPTDTTAPAPDANGGPEVEFMPLGLHGPIKPGIYRIFGQFNPDNKLFVTDFTIKVE